jgi:SAM-dependent methyltransferase
VALHPLAERFASIADVYERGRPEYAPAVVGALSAELGLVPRSTVLDLAAGTGKLTRALAAAGLDVVAVEPHASMRELLATRLGGGRALDGHAESIPLDDGSVSAVTVADAFHWFDQQAALAEIRRILRPGGGLAVLASVPDWSGASWAHELGTMMHGLRPEHPHFDGPPWHEAVRAAGGWGPPREVRVSASQPTSAEQLVDYTASMSWVAAMPEQERAATLAKVSELVHAGETPREMPVHVVIGLAQLSPTA